MRRSQQRRRYARDIQPGHKRAILAPTLTAQRVKKKREMCRKMSWMLARVGEDSAYLPG
jgi:hypothetical protein